MTPMRGALQELIDKGKARVSAMAYIRSVAGQRAKLKAGDEIISPTQFDPAETPQKLVGEIAEDVRITTHVSPTAFEVRQTGVDFSIDTALDPSGQVLEVNVSPEMTAYLGEKTYGKDEAEMTQPVFYSLKTTTAIALKPGEYSLIAVHTPHGAVGADGMPAPDRAKRLLVFLRATVLEMPPAKASKAEGKE
jgi:hypothetical protein